MAVTNQLIVLPAPPRYTGQAPEDYANQMNRWLDNLYRYVTGLTYLRGNGLFLPSLPMTGAELRVDEVFANGGVLTIVRATDIWIDTFAVTAYAGTVTIN